MGMFTTIIDNNKQSYQIKTGDDNLDVYHIGDTVDWHVWKDEYNRSVLLDGVYRGTGDKDEKWIIIKDHKITDIIELESPDNLSKQYDDLVKKYEIEFPGDELWTKAAKKKCDRHQAKYQKEWQKKMEQYSQLTPEQQFARTFIDMSIGRQLKYQSILDKILKVKKIKNVNKNTKDE